MLGITKAFQTYIAFVDWWKGVFRSKNQGPCFQAPAWIGWADRSTLANRHTISSKNVWPYPYPIQCD